MDALVACNDLEENGQAMYADASQPLRTNSTGMATPAVMFQRSMFICNWSSNKRKRSLLSEVRPVSTRLQIVDSDVAHGHISALLLHCKHECSSLLFQFVAVIDSVR